MGRLPAQDLDAHHGQPGEHENHEDLKGGAVESREALTLEAIHKDLLMLEKRIEEMNAALEAKLAAQTEEMRQEVRRVARDAIRGDEEIHDEIRRQTLDAWAEQKVEAGFFAAGLVFQIGAAILLLAC